MCFLSNCNITNHCTYPRPDAYRNTSSKPRQRQGGGQEGGRGGGGGRERGGEIVGQWRATPTQLVKREGEWKKE